MSECEREIEKERLPPTWLPRASERAKKNKREREREREIEKERERERHKK